MKKRHAAVEEAYAAQVSPFAMKSAGPGVALIVVRNQRKK